jgi:mRNA-degrading endonuclease toxin of MazEF toxin-antitoxin module
MNRGDICLINLGGRIGIRPVVVLARQKILDHLNRVIVAEITTLGKDYPIFLRTEL